MLFGQSRDELRQFYFKVWRKHKNNLPLEPLEQILTDVMLQHPEYHAMLENPGNSLDKEYLPDFGASNPFLHMGMHIGIREQLATDRPAGLRTLYQQLLNRHKDAHHVEHQIMECLAEMIWQAQRHRAEADEASYLECLRKRARE